MRPVRGDNFGALHHLARFRLPVLARMAAPERIEAAVRAGDQAAARDWTEELARFADATRRPWALATVAYGRALTASQGDAEGLFQESLGHHDRAGRPMDAARTHEKPHASATRPRSSSSPQWSSRSLSW